MSCLEKLQFPQVSWKIPPWKPEQNTKLMYEWIATGADLCRRRIQAHFKEKFSSAIGFYKVILIDKRCSKLIQLLCSSAASSLVLLLLFGKEGSVQCDTWRLAAMLNSYHGTAAINLIATGWSKIGWCWENVAEELPLDRACFHFRKIFLRLLNHEVHTFFKSSKAAYYLLSWVCNL